MFIVADLRQLEVCEFAYACVQILRVHKQACTENQLIPKSKNYKEVSLNENTIL